MIFIRQLKYFFQLILLGIFISGCAGAGSGQQYIPTSLSMGNLNQLAVIQLTNPGEQTPKGLTLDGETIKKNRIYVAPGEHILKYRINMPTDEWVQKRAEMEAKGWNLVVLETSFATFRHPLTSQTARIVVGNMYKETPKSITLNLSAGETFVISNW